MHVDFIYIESVFLILDQAISHLASSQQLQVGIEKEQRLGVKGPGCGVVTLHTSLAPVYENPVA
jgi:hypothetical protein